ncbi:unnamed protein product [Diatraea saccharalis]|uniref:Activating transcription factor 7-interacting protein Fn3 domain-containing protein n=1 Tax=Diatraea saccharalis TaxID=40085 RepID=A0A9N9WDC8_9NEOP|nr:unnamed protein product [Diatraea saccharalis]
MQLILDTEASIHIQEKMTTVEETMKKNDNNTDETLKNVISNGNKENMQCQENIMKISEEERNGFQKRDDNDEEDVSLPIIENKEYEIKKNDDLQLLNDKDENYTKVNDNGNVASKEIDERDASESDSCNDTIEKERESFDSDLKEKSSVLVIKSNNLQDISLSIAKGEEKRKETNTSETDTVNVDVLEKNNDNPMDVSNEIENNEQINLKSTADSAESLTTTALTEDSDYIHDDVTGSKNSSFETNMDVDEHINAFENVVDVRIECNAVNAIPNQSEPSATQEVLCESISSTDKDNTLKQTSLLHNNSTVMNSENTTLVDNTIDSDNITSIEKEVLLENVTSVDKAIEVDDSMAVDKVEVLPKTPVNQSEVLEITMPDEEPASTMSLDKTASDIATDNNLEFDQGEPSHVSSSNKQVKDNTLSVDEKLNLQNSKSADEVTVLGKTTTNEELNEEMSSADVDKDIVIEKAPSLNIESEENITLMDKEEILDVDSKKNVFVGTEPKKPKENLAPKSKVEVQNKPFSKLSNTLDILSDDEDDAPKIDAKESGQKYSNSMEKQCINIEDDDDIMLIDEDVKDNKSISKSATTENKSEEKEKEICDESTIDLKNATEIIKSCTPADDETTETDNDTLTSEKKTQNTNVTTEEGEKPKEETFEKPVKEKPLLPVNFLKAYKKNLTDMTREDLEEFCVFKIVESIVDRSNLSDIKSKLKEMAQNIEEYKKKTMMLTKQNRDLQVVLKSVQEEQKKNADNPTVITPLKITRSVGMQVLMIEKPGTRKKVANTPNVNNNTSNRNVRTANQSPKTQKPSGVSPAIPVPRLVLANNPIAKIPPATAQGPPNNSQAKTPSPVPNGMRNSSPVQKVAEKRPISRLSSVTVDLTDDEPPAKMTPRNSPAPPIRLVSPQNLLAPRQAFGQTLNSPRKVYIPISGPQSQNIRPGQAIMLKTVPQAGSTPRPRVAPPHLARMPQNTVRMQSRGQNRHPAPLPDAVKQYQPPNWKALPPAPDLKLSKVENGIVISWKIDGYLDDSYEEIASYQLYAYQETSSPPSTALWKKIGDVKALPLPMACTLTHVMAGFKYYFAVRAVDIRSRLGPFSLPGSILLLNKL